MEQYAFATREHTRRFIGELLVNIRKSETVWDALKCSILIKFEFWKALLELPVRSVARKSER